MVRDQQLINHSNKAKHILHSVIESEGDDYQCFIVVFIKIIKLYRVSNYTFEIMTD